MTIEIPAAISLMIFAAAAGALVSLTWMQRRITAALAVRAALLEESRQLKLQLSRAEAHAAALQERVLSMEGAEAERRARLVEAGDSPERFDAAGRRRVSGIQELSPSRIVRVPPDPDEIAPLAESLWASAGKPRGRDREFWFQAETRLLTERLSGRPPAIDELEVTVEELEPEEETGRAVG